MKTFILFCFSFLIPVLLQAEVDLEKLIDYDALTCSALLKNSDPHILKDHFLKGQATLFIKEEVKLLNSEKGWREGVNILEMGSGNGNYLFALSELSKEKRFIGIEKNDSMVEKSNQFENAFLTFLQGDVEVYEEKYFNRFDVVLLRLTLQHLENPRSALKNAHDYLKSDGVVIIIDSYDCVRESSHRISSLEKITLELQKRNKNLGNREITMEILREIENQGLLSLLYKVSRTSVDTSGKRLEKGIRFETEEDRKCYFNHALLFLAVLNKEKGIAVDFSSAYVELQVYLRDKNSWISPGVHFLVLKKI